MKIRLIAKGSVQISPDDFAVRFHTKCFEVPSEMEQWIRATAMYGLGSIVGVEVIDKESEVEE